MQNALRDLAMVSIRVRLQFVLGSGSVFGLGLVSGLGQKVANCACAISKLRNALCKLRRMTMPATFIQRIRVRVRDRVRNKARFRYEIY